MKRSIRWGRVRLRRQVINPVLYSLKRGASSPHKIALTIVLGITIGLIPVVGMATVILIALATRMKLNMFIIQAASFAVYPLHILFYIPFFKLGLLLHPSGNAPSTFQEFIMLARASWTDALAYFGSATIFAVLAWFLVAMPLGILLYNIMYRVIKKTVAIGHR